MIYIYEYDLKKIWKSRNGINNSDGFKSGMEAEAPPPFRILQFFFIINYLDFKHYAELHVLIVNYYQKIG